MNTDMGVAPYDAFPIIVHDRLLKNIPFKYVRMGYDFLAIIIGYLLGGIDSTGGNVSEHRFMIFTCTDATVIIQQDW